MRASKAIFDQVLWDLVDSGHSITFEKVDSGPILCTIKKEGLIPTVIATFRLYLSLLTDEAMLNKFIHAFKRGLKL